MQPYARFVPFFTIPLTPVLIYAFVNILIFYTIYGTAFGLYKLYGFMGKLNPKLPLMIYGGIFSVIFIMLLLKFLGDDPE